MNQNPAVNKSDWKKADHLAEIFELDEVTISLENKQRKKIYYGKTVTVKRLLKKISYYRSQASCMLFGIKGPLSDEKCFLFHLKGFFRSLDI